MITALAFAAILGSPVQDKIDFQLGWKKGDKITYVVTLGATTSEIASSKAEQDLIIGGGDLVLTVTDEDDRGFVVTASRIELVNDPGFAQKYPDRTGIRPFEACTLRVSRTARTSPVGARNPKSSVQHFTYWALPDGPVAVGEDFHVTMIEPNFPVETIQFDGKFVSLGGPGGALATLEMEGHFPYRGRQFSIFVKTTFDTARGTVVSHSVTMFPSKVISSMKLK